MTMQLNLDIYRAKARVGSVVIPFQTTKKRLIKLIDVLVSDPIFF